MYFSPDDLDTDITSFNNLELYYLVSEILELGGLSCLISSERLYINYPDKSLENRTKLRFLFTTTHPPIYDGEKYSTKHYAGFINWADDEISIYKIGSSRDDYDPSKEAIDYTNMFNKSTFDTTHPVRNFAYVLGIQYLIQKRNSDPRLENLSPNSDAFHEKVEKYKHTIDNPEASHFQGDYYLIAEPTASLDPVSTRVLQYQIPDGYLYDMDAEELEKDGEISFDLVEYFVNEESIHLFEEGKSNSIGEPITKTA